MGAAQGFFAFIILPTKRLQLAGSGKADVHELHLVHHPQAVVIEQPELHRPARAWRAIAAVERA